MKTFSMIVLTFALLGIAACNNAAVTDSADITEDEDRMAILLNRIDLLETKVAEQQATIAENQMALAAFKNLLEKTYAAVDRLSRAPRLRISPGDATAEGLAVPSDSIPFQFNGDTYYITPTTEQARANTQTQADINYKLDE